MQTFEQANVVEARKTPIGYAVRDYGVDHEQYFGGVSLAFEPYDGVATGCGDTLTEAFEDALDDAAQQGYDTSNIEYDTSYDTSSAHDECHVEEGRHDECGLHRYVAVFFDTAPEVK